LRWRGRRAPPAQEVANASVGGDLYLIQNVAGGVSVNPGQPVRSRYLETVRRIAPDELIGRDAELAALAEFCAGSGDASYLWWRAPAWAGKSALMSWFVLHPPPRVRVVSFFVTARFAAQDGRSAFTDAVFEQLLDLLGQTRPAMFTEATREAHLLGALDDAAGICAERAERLVLLVDGLDEDRGVTSAPDAHSIASLLPARPPHGSRVVVAGRPQPPVPDDVPRDHPLRDARIIRPLRRSPAAAAIEGEARRELSRLLRGSRLQRDLLGLLTAADGGLSDADLAELTGTPAWELRDELGSVSGRTFTARPSALRPGGDPEVYLLGHEELRAIATERLGPEELGRYRQRLHRWADRYRRLDWPAQTPEYLLRGYFGMLRATGDLARMLSCATDTQRHDRMRDSIGGDADALDEVVTVQDLLLARPDPDLRAMMLLSVQRNTLGERNVNIPARLPALWADLGQPGRGANLAAAISEPDTQLEALTHLVAAVAAAGDRDLARQLADRGVALARGRDSRMAAHALAHLAVALAAQKDLDHATVVLGRITDRAVWADAAAGVAIRAAWAGEFDRAEAMARDITEPYERAMVVIELADAVADSGNRDRARHLAGRAERLLADITEHLRSQLLAALARVVRRAGQPQRARDLVDRAEALAHLVDYPRLRAETLTAVAVGLAGVGEVDRAIDLAGRDLDPDQRFEVLVRIAAVVLEAGDDERALALARDIGDPVVDAWVSTSLCLNASRRGEHDRAVALAEQAEAQLRRETDPERRVRGLADLVPVAARADPGRAAALTGEAETVATTIVDPRQRAESLTVLAERVARTGDHARALALARSAEAVARSILEPNWVMGQMANPTTPADAEIPAGSARTVLDLAEIAAHGFTNPVSRAAALAHLAVCLARIGNRQRAGDLIDRAIRVAGDAAEPYDRVLSLTALIRPLLVVAGRDRARIALVRAEALTAQLTDPDTVRRALIHVTEGAGRIGDSDRAAALSEHAEALLNDLPDPSRRAEQLVDLVTALAHPDHRARVRPLAHRAEALISDINHANTSAPVLAELAAALARTGAHEHARTLAGDAARTVVHAHPAVRAIVLTMLVTTLASMGDHEHADDLADEIEAIAEDYRIPDLTLGVLTRLVPAVIDNADHDRARRLGERIESLARDKGSAHERGRALTAVAAAYIGAMPAAAWLPGRRGDQQVLAARRMLAAALAAGPWIGCLDLLARVQPGLLTVDLTALAAAGDADGAVAAAG
jgi:tetratricopeptide (TPR) repeat protein